MIGENLELIEQEYNNATAKHPDFVQHFDSLPLAAIQSRLNTVRDYNEKSAKYSCEEFSSIIEEELLEAEEAFKTGNKQACLTELAQCGAVILRAMDFTRKELK